MREEEDEDKRKEKMKMKIREKLSSFPLAPFFSSCSANFFSQFFQSFGSKNFTLPPYDLSINF
jgi:hypothetical protein